jgi:hypothetical protein
LQNDSSNDYSNSNRQEFNGLADGSHTVEVRATNVSGTDATPAKVTWTVGTSTPPHVTDTNPNSRDTGVARTIKPTVTFDTDLDADTVNSQNVKLQAYSTKKKWVTISSTPNYNNRIVTATPATTLGSQKRYRVVLNTNIESATGKNLEQPFGFGFTTRR